MRSTWGSRRQRQKGVWEISYVPPGGTRKYETVRGTARDADDRLAIRYSQYHSVGDIDTTLSAYWADGYQPHLKSLSPSAQAGYESMWRCHIEPKFGNRVMSSIRPSEMQAWLDTLSSGVASHAKTLLSSIFQCAYRDDLVKSNIMRTGYRMPHKDAVEVNHNIFTLEQMESILADCTGEWWESYYILAAFGGLRRSEAVGVCVEDITEHGGYLAIDIHRNVQMVKSELVITESTKTGVDRYAIIPPPYSYRLSELIQDRESGWLVPDGDSPINPDNMSIAWRRWFQTRDYGYIPWKNLRNSYVTAMNAAGYDSALISKLCGHSTLVDYAHYNRPTPDDLINGLLSGASTNKCLDVG